MDTDTRYCYGNYCSCDALDILDEKRAEAGFHWRNGIYFKRMPDGSVRIRQFCYFNYSPTYKDWIIPASEWATIISGVSIDGASKEKYDAGLLFHNG